MHSILISCTACGDFSGPVWSFLTKLRPQPPVAAQPAPPATQMAPEEVEHAAALPATASIAPPPIWPSREGAAPLAAVAGNGAEESTVVLFCKKCKTVGPKTACGCPGGTIHLSLVPFVCESGMSPRLVGSLHENPRAVPGRGRRASSAAGLAG
jgi:hypothetical protein